MDREVFTPIKKPVNGQIRVVNHSKIVGVDPHKGVTTEQHHTFEQFWDGEWLPINVIERTG